MRTRYIFHYDLESDVCVEAARKLVEIHRQHDVPATFFILGTVIERWGEELKALFGDDPLFDAQSHTYSHRMLKDSRMHGPGISLDEVRKEISLGVQLVRERLERPCIGVRSGCGFFKGLQGEDERLGVISEYGVKYLSTDLRGPADSIPSGLQQAYWYDEEGYPQLLEMPGHGWHDNVLKSPDPRLCLPYPPVLLWGIPNRPPRSPEEEVTVQRVWIEKAISLKLDYVSLVYHPCSIYRMNEECRTMELLIREVKAFAMPTTTYTQLREFYSAHPDLISRNGKWDWENQYERGGPIGLIQS